MALYFLEYFGEEEPVVELEAADAEGVLQVLAGAGGVAVEGDGEGGYFDFGHGGFLQSFRGKLYATASEAINMGLW